VPRRSATRRITPERRHRGGATGRARPRKAQRPPGSGTDQKKGLGGWHRPCRKVTTRDVTMKHLLVMTILASCAGAAFAQNDDKSARENPNFQSHRPLGSNNWPTPYDPKDQTDFGRSWDQQQPREQASADQDEYVRRAKEWRRLQYRQQNPLGVNLSGDPDAHGYSPAQPSARRYSPAPQPYSSGSNAGTSSYGGSSYSQRRPRYTPPSPYGEAARRDNSWLRPNFGRPPAPPAPPTYRPAPQPTHRTTMQCFGNPQARC
jgi:hypothetical protein